MIKKDNLATAGRYNFAVDWNGEGSTGKTSKLRHTYRLERRGRSVRSVNVSNDNRYLIITYEENIPRIRVVDLEKLEFLPHDYDGHTATVRLTNITADNKEKYNFYYYPLGEEGITKMFKDIIKLLQSENIDVDSTKILEDPVNNVHTFLEKLFRAGAGNKPVLILDHAHYVSDPGGIGTIVKLARKWKEIILILTGDTMDNAFQEDFYEFILGPWGREA